MSARKAVLICLLGGFLGALAVALLTAIVGAVHQPPNTDPRKGRVIIDDNGGWGATPSWKQCADTTLIISIPGVEYGTRYIDDSPECQP